MNVRFGSGLIWMLQMWTPLSGSCDSVREAARIVGRSLDVLSLGVVGRDFAIDVDHEAKAVDGHLLVNHWSSSTGDWFMTSDTAYRPLVLLQRGWNC